MVNTTLIFFNDKKMNIDIIIKFHFWLTRYIFLAPPEYLRTDSNKTWNFFSFFIINYYQAKLIYVAVLKKIDKNNRYIIKCLLLVPHFLFIFL